MKQLPKNGVSVYQLTTFANSIGTPCHFSKFSDGCLAESFANVWQFGSEITMVKKEPNQPGAADRCKKRSGG